MSEFFTMRSTAYTLATSVLVTCLAFGSGLAASADQGKIPDTIAQRVAACVVCHGKEGRAGSDGYYPRIAGKTEGYLFNQLANFRDGRRNFPAMNHLVAQFSDSYLQEIAHYFATLELPYAAAQPATADAATLQRGSTLVQRGDPDKKLPACVACHGQALTGMQPATPGLLGLPRDYLVAQLGAWQVGQRRAHAPDCMAQIAKTLTQADIYAVSSWLAAQNPPANAKPAAASSQPLPLQCGASPIAAGGSK